MAYVEYKTITRGDYENRERTCSKTINKTEHSRWRDLEIVGIMASESACSMFKGAALLDPHQLLPYLNIAAGLSWFIKKTQDSVSLCILPLFKCWQLILKIHYFLNSDLIEDHCDPNLAHCLLIGGLWSLPILCTQENASTLETE